jgi:hypothetical protein
MPVLQGVWSSRGRGGVDRRGEHTGNDMASRQMVLRHRGVSEGWFCRFVLWLRQQQIPASLRGDRWTRQSRLAGSRLRLLWVSARPVLFLTALCFFVGVVFLAVSLALSTAFFLAGFSALALALRMLPTFADAVAE